MLFSKKVPEITVTELKAMQDRKEPFHLLDVRQPAEREIASLGGQNIPLQELPNRLDELDDQRGNTIVVYCRSGGRSGQAAKFLQKQGFEDIINLKGGTLAWSREVDPSVPTY